MVARVRGLACKVRSCGDERQRRRGVVFGPCRENCQLACARCSSLWRALAANRTFRGNHSASKPSENRLQGPSGVLFVSRWAAPLSGSGGTPAAYHTLQRLAYSCWHAQRTAFDLPTAAAAARPLCRRCLRRPRLPGILPVHSAHVCLQARQGLQKRSRPRDAACCGWGGRGGRVLRRGAEPPVPPRQHCPCVGRPSAQGAVWRHTGSSRACCYIAACQHGRRMGVQ